MKFYIGLITAVAMFTVTMVALIVAYRDYSTPRQLTDRYGNNCVYVRSAVTCSGHG